MNRSGSNISAVCWMIEPRSFSVCSMSRCRLSEVYSPLRSLITPGTRTKSTRARKSKRPMIGEPDRISTETLLEALHQRMRDRAAAAQVAEAERVVAVDQDAPVGPPVAHVLVFSLVADASVRSFARADIL